LLVSCIVALVLAAQTPAATLTQKADVFLSAHQSYVLTGTPASGSLVEVFLNGLLQLNGADYVLSVAATPSGPKSQVTFTGQKTANMSNPIVQVVYWVSR